MQRVRARAHLLFLPDSTGSTLTPSPPSPPSGSQYGRIPHVHETVHPDPSFFARIPYFREQQTRLSRLLRRVLVKPTAVPPSRKDIQFILRLVLPTTAFNDDVPSTRDGGFWWSHVFQGFHAGSSSSIENLTFHQVQKKEHFLLLLRMCCKSAHTALDWQSYF